ncbi:MULTISPECIES: aldo/keto reductase [unclassified Pseudomonas]|jgi:2,5-diketo-D-gluconate reductase B|uniref:aldo/keto reductase n=1 Tax=unclassified Pseudomonas TaxID=196821 RepID=UPI0007319C70|nr:MULTISPECIES: aldo/keto reductase [unclassified Pseudomonas]KSW22319.1 aldo/keto reductase [Pseudomonas sp. ADP]OBP10238.1 aldo/keto reductase [Pseudomonas sp. EGD-AKN5]QOF85119.1 aldo/keto reductase [Pseudomonas sp. ADPe]
MQARIRNRHGLNMPKLGLGTWPLTGAECSAAVRQALELGYRHIDTAAGYHNEDAVGQALADSPVAREDVHVTSKVWWDRLAPADLAQSLDDSLRALRSDYLDLFMIHWPGKNGSLVGDDLKRSVEALVAARDSGKARAIGVANFPLALLRETVETLGAPLAAIQVEYHLMLDQSALLDYARAHDMALTAYTPLGRGRMLEEPAIQAIAQRHGVLPSQVALAWLLEQDAVAAIPKAASLANQRSNLAALDLRLDDEDRAQIAALPKNVRLVSPEFAPKWD